MRGFITVCFSDWTKETFDNGIMRIIRGKRSDVPIRRPIRSDEVEGIDYYRKPDPDFLNFTYSRCHKKLRQQLQENDVLFFRTLWRGRQYLIGYFTIKEKRGDPQNPICIAEPSKSLLINFNLEITPELVKKLNPRARFNKSRHLNMWINEWLGRNYLKLPPEATNYLMELIKNKSHLK